jgi:mRNA interferase MazF
MNRADPRRGRVWWVAFDRSVSGETRKTRPAVMVSNDAANRALKRVQVVPLTRKVTKVYPAQALVTLEGASEQGYGRPTHHGFQAEAARAHRQLDPVDMAAVDRAIGIQLAL